MRQRNPGHELSSPNLLRDFRDVLRRLTTLERSAPGIVIDDVAAGGAPWTSASGTWIDPTSVPLYTQVRVTGTPTGDRLFIVVRDSGGVADWQPII